MLRKIHNLKNTKKKPQKQTKQNKQKQKTKNKKKQKTPKKIKCGLYQSEYYNILKMYFVFNSVKPKFPDY